MSPVRAAAVMTGCGRFAPFMPALPPPCGRPAGLPPSGLAKTNQAVPPMMQNTNSHTHQRRHQPDLAPRYMPEGIRSSSASGAGLIASFRDDFECFSGGLQLYVLPLLVL